MWLSFVIRLQLSLVCLAVLGCGSGCFHSWINDWLDPSEMGAFDTVHTSEIRRSISVLEEPGGLSDASDPLPEDLVVRREEYRVAVGDTLGIRIFELLAGGAESLVTPMINASGSIFVPELEWLQAEGMTVREIQAMIKDELRSKGILKEPTVDVTVIGGRQRVFHVFGLITRPGTYQIPAPDFRLLEALLMGGGLTDLADHVYVFRGTEGEEAKDEGAFGSSLPISTTRAGDPEGEEEGQEFAPSVEGGPGEDYEYKFGQLSLSSFGQEASPDGRGSGALEDPVAVEGLSETQPGQDEAIDSTLDEDLLEALRPQQRVAVEAGETSGGAGASAESAPARIAETSPARGAVAQDETEDRPVLSHWIWLNGNWIEVTTQPSSAEGGAGAATSQARSPATAATQRVVDWEDLEVPATNRIISVPAGPLREGDARYNLVIRPNDSIRIAAGQTGNYYLMGHVIRPGVYALAGFNVTVKQAIAAAGGLEALAWPDRCEVVRRIGPDRETIIPIDLDRIFSGREADLFLKPDDIVNVGTHAAAPFLATLRSAFRLTYGFGFVWDRNFGDIEGQGGSPNPRRAREAAQAAQLPGLFP